MTEWLSEMVFTWFFSNIYFIFTLYGFYSFMLSAIYVNIIEEMNASYLLFKKWTKFITLMLIALVGPQKTWN